jgi:cell division topological specificity factor MinE
MMKNERRARSAKRGGAASSERRRRDAFRVLAVASSSSSSSDASGTGLKTKSDISSIFDDAKVTQETTFWGKLSAAYRIFFPPSEADTARAEAKKRLRMILVADRCTMSDESMEEMKRKIIDVVEQYVELDEDVPVDVKVKDDVKFGTVYGITVPVSKVKAEFDAENEAYMIGAQFVYDDETWEELQKETDEEED